MEKSYTFVRGQVWYWDDPICGRKENNEEAPPLDASVRFSRYVLVVQTTETINFGSVLVAPMSSTHKCPVDVVIPLASVNNHSNARIGSIFPAKPKSLQRYICTVSEEVMKKVDERILALLIPGMVDLSLFTQEYEESQITDNEDAPSAPVLQKKARTTKWDDETIESFLKVYQEEGIDAACQKFELKKNSARKYFFQWGNKNIDNGTPINIKIVNSKDAPCAVSKLSNAISNYVRSDKMLDDLIPKQTPAEEFHRQFGNSIYYSLLEFLSIRKEFGSFIIPKVNSNNKNIKTWHLLDTIWYDNTPCWPNGQRIDNEWMKLLKARLASRISLTGSEIEILCKRIETIFCTEEKAS